MKLYAFSTPEIEKHTGYLKIGETNGNIAERVKQQGHELNVEKMVVWSDAVITDRIGIDKIIRRYLKEQGFQIQQFGTGWDAEWVECTVGDVKKAFEIIKQRLYEEEKQRAEVGNQFYLEIRNWFYWTTQENEKIDADYALRLVVRLLFCFFLREKNELVPKELLNSDILKHLKSNEEFSYYNGILRNLFFHCLNTPQNERKYESEKLLVDKKKIKEWFLTTPFLNGGIFDEHDKDDIPIGNDYFFSERKKRLLTELGEICDVYGIITILSKYKYKLTLDDLLDQAEYGETVDPEFIGKVFESLLSCIHAESQKTRQKITGSYYTPREIVDYMVNEALNTYLEQSRNRKIASEQSQSYDCGSDLLQCKIFDPACGSGAFPCEAMNIILHRIEEEKKEKENKGFSSLERYRTKLKIIRDVIYGVDIQPMAVQITLLRFFLSLIRDIVPDKQKPNFGIEPLPNLETKFVCADTLMPLVTDHKDAEGKYQKMLENPVIRNTNKLLRDNRRHHFMASTTQRKQEILQTDKTLRETLAIAMESDGMMTHEATKRMATWNPYDQTRSASFFDPGWMFGIDSFDIVIGNPPYGAEYPAEYKDYFREYYKSAKTTRSNGIQRKGSLDTFSLFIENGFNSLKENGVLVFIVPVAVLSSDSMGALHKLLFDHCKTIKVSSYAKRPVQIFHDACIANTIIGLTKTNTKCESLLTTKMNRLVERDSLRHLLSTLKFTDGLRFCMRGRIPKISLPIEKRILKKLFEKNHIPIRDRIDESGNPIYYRTSGGRYYNVVTNYPTGSTKEKPMFLDSKLTNTVGAALSSHLFWWYQQVYSNSLDLKSYEIESFPIPVNNLTPAIRRKIEKLYEQYLQDIENRVIVRETKEYKHITKFKEYKIRYSKALIDAIDDLICPLYGLTKEETEFIKNYEIEFRLAAEEIAIVEQS